MTAQALKQAALDHLAAENVSACSLPLGDGRLVCAGERERLIELVGMPAPYFIRSKESIDDLLQQLDSFATRYAFYEMGLPMHDTKTMHQIVRAWLATPPVDKDQL